MANTVGPSIVNSVHALQFKEIPVRITTADNMLWFVASDVFKCLGVHNTTTAVQHLDQDETRLISILGQRPLNALSERGLRKRLMRCKKPEASALMDWVTHVAIPAYTDAAKAEKQVKSDAVQRLAARVVELEQQVSALAKKTPLAMLASLRTQ